MITLTVPADILTPHTDDDSTDDTRDDDTATHTRDDDTTRDRVPASAAHPGRTDTTTHDRSASAAATHDADADADADTGVRTTGVRTTGGDPEDLVEVLGLSGGHGVFVPRGWLTDHLKDRPPGPGAPCHRVTGALLDPAATTTGDDGRSDRAAGDRLGRAAAAFGADRYRPSRRIAKLVRSRDRRCRFPGCTVAAVFCDLDHVRPWPHGPSTPDNLICLCRRHHRIKQRPGWRVTLTPDGVATWTDPTGRVRTTEPVDALHATVLRAPPAPSTAAAAASTSSRPRGVLPDGPHSDLEFRLEHLGATPPGSPPGWRGYHGRHHVDVIAGAGGLVRYEPVHHRSHRRNRSASRRSEPGPPPF